MSRANSSGASCIGSYNALLSETTYKFFHHVCIDKKQIFLQILNQRQKSSAQTNHNFTFKPPLSFHKIFASTAHKNINASPFSRWYKAMPQTLHLSARKNPFPKKNKQAQKFCARKFKPNWSASFSTHNFNLLPFVSLILNYRKFKFFQTNIRLETTTMFHVKHPWTKKNASAMK